MKAYWAGLLACALWALPALAQLDSTSTPNQNSINFYGGGVIIGNGTPNLNPTDLTGAKTGSQVLVSLVPHACPSFTSCPEGNSVPGTVFYNATQHTYTFNPASQAGALTAMTWHDSAAGGASGVQNQNFSLLTDGVWAGVNETLHLKVINGAQNNFAIDIEAGDIDMETSGASKIIFPQSALAIQDLLWLDGQVGGTNFALANGFNGNGLLLVKFGSVVPSLSFDNVHHVGLLGTLALAPKGDVVFEGTAPVRFGYDQMPTANTAGVGMTIFGQEAANAATDKAGGPVTIAPGLSHGTATGNYISLQRSAVSTTGNSANPVVDGFMVMPAKNIPTNNTATPLFDMALSDLAQAGGTIQFSDYATDNVDTQVVSGVVVFSAVHKFGTSTTGYTVKVANAAGTDCGTPGACDGAGAVSGGTLTTAWTLTTTATNKVTMQVTPNTSLTALQHRLRYNLSNTSPATVTLIP